MTKNTGTENSTGPMEDSIRVFGRMDANTAREYTGEAMEPKERVNGKMAKKSDGWMNDITNFNL
jgi:hypothetical protein